MKKPAFILLCLVFFTGKIQIYKDQGHQLLASKSDIIGFDFKKLSVSGKQLHLDSLPIEYHTETAAAAFWFKPAYYVHHPGEQTTREKYVFELNSGYKIRHHVNKHTDQQPEIFYPEYIQILDHTFDLDSLFANALTTRKQVKRVSLSFEEAFTFSFNSRQFILLSAWYRLPILNAQPHFWILADISREDRPEVYAFFDNSSPEDEYHCFSDFNADGQLDYVEQPVSSLQRWEAQTQDIARFYSLINQRFVQDTAHYLVIKPVYPSSPDPDYRPYQIIPEKSRWFFDLRSKK